MTIYFHVIFWSDLCCRSKEYFFPMSRLKKIRYSDEYIPVDTSCYTVDDDF